MSFSGKVAPKATPTTHHTIASSMLGKGIARASAAAGFQVGRGANLAAQGAKAFGKAVIGQDDFTQQVSRQAKNK